MTTSVKTYALKALDGRLLASFCAFTLDEAQQRAFVVAKALNLTSDWNLVEMTYEPREVPLFDESFFVTWAQALHKVN